MKSFYHLLSYSLVVFICLSTITPLGAQIAHNKARRRAFGLALKTYRMHALCARRSSKCLLRKKGRKLVSRQALQRSTLAKRQGQNRVAFARRKAAHQATLARNYTKRAFHAEGLEKQNAALEAQRHTLAQQLAQEQEQTAQRQIRNAQALHDLQTAIQLEQGRVSSLQTQLQRTEAEAQELKKLQLNEKALLAKIVALQTKSAKDEARLLDLEKNYKRLLQAKAENPQALAQEFKHTQELIDQPTQQAPQEESSQESNQDQCEIPADAQEEQVAPVQSIPEPTLPSLSTITPVSLQPHYDDLDQTRNTDQQQATVQPVIPVEPAQDTQQLLLPNNTSSNSNGNGSSEPQSTTPSVSETTKALEPVSLLLNNGSKEVMINITDPNFDTYLLRKNIPVLKARAGNFNKYLNDTGSSLDTLEGAQSRAERLKPFSDKIKLNNPKLTKRIVTLLDKSLNLSNGLTLEDKGLENFRALTQQVNGCKEILQKEAQAKQAQAHVASIPVAQAPRVVTSAPAVMATPEPSDREKESDSDSDNEPLDLPLEGVVQSSNGNTLGNQQAQVTSTHDSVRRALEHQQVLIGLQKPRVEESDSDDEKAQSQKDDAAIDLAVSQEKSPQPSRWTRLTNVIRRR